MPIVLATCAILAGCPYALSPAGAAGEDIEIAARQPDDAAGTAFDNEGSRRALSALFPAPGSAAGTEAALEKLVALDPKNVSHRLSLAFLHATQGLRDKAMADVDGALALDPASGKAHLLKGYIHEAAQDLPEAIGEYTTAVALAKAARDTGLTIEGLLRLGYLYDNARLFFDAVAQFETIIRISPACRRAHLELARIVYRLGLTDRSIAVLRSLIISDRDVPQAYAMLGIAYFKKGLYETSLRYFTMAKRSGADVGDDIITAVEDKVREAREMRD